MYIFIFIKYKNMNFCFWILLLYTAIIITVIFIYKNTKSESYWPQTDYAYTYYDDKNESDKSTPTTTPIQTGSQINPKFTLTPNGNYKMNMYRRISGQDWEQIGTIPAGGTSYQDTKTPPTQLYSCVNNNCKIDTSGKGDSLDICNSKCTPSSDYKLNYNNTDDNYLKIYVDPITSNNYFMIIGDWGGNFQTPYGNVQKAVAAKMLEYYNKQKSSGKNLLFIATVGDNFYWMGQDGTTWDSNWSDIYDINLRNVPWFPVMGNHDWGNDDPYCLCPENAHEAIIFPNGTSYKCNQLNSDKHLINTRPKNTINYHFPDFCYHYTIKDLDFELIALSGDYLDSPGGIGGDGPNKGAKQTALNCGDSEGKGMTAKLKKIYDAGQQLLQDRAKNTSNTNILITNHYSTGSEGSAPIDHAHACKDLRDSFIANSTLKQYQTVICAGGHVHSTGCIETDPTGNLCINILTGGGGGCCDPNPSKEANGFYVVKFNDNKKMSTERVVLSSNINYSLGNYAPMYISDHSPDEMH